MIYKINRASGDRKPCNAAYKKQPDDEDWYIEISNLQSLHDIIKETGTALIVEYGEPSLVVYDDYLE